MGKNREKCIFANVTSHNDEMHIILMFEVLNGPKYPLKPQVDFLDSLPTGKSDFETFLRYKGK